VRLVIGDPEPGLPSAAHAAAGLKAFVEEFEASLSRFRPESELCALNLDPRNAVPASSLLRAAVRAGIRAAERSGGLVDPTLLHELERAGYERSRTGIVPASLREALALAPARRPAAPSAAARWKAFRVDDESGVVRRPCGFTFDTGGVGKGLAADLMAERLQGYSRFVVDCGGDMRVGGRGGDACDVHFAHPLVGRVTHAVSIPPGAIATSGIDVRIWRRADGRFAHHLLDPSTGEPAWTGLVGATAIAATALEAETLSKAALLSGPAGARDLLAAGGMIVHDDGEVEAVGPVSLRPYLRLTVPGDFGVRSAA
jgi:thiamine biosynthesis lipoprotein